MAEFSVRLADWSGDQEALRHVRTIVFVEEQAVPESEEWDGLDEACWHVVAEAPAPAWWVPADCIPPARSGAWRC
jgi:predicted GNAT family N-acyltransferase